MAKRTPKRKPTRKPAKRKAGKRKPARKVSPRPAKKTAAAKKTPGPSRPKSLMEGERKAILAVKKAMGTHGEDNPVVMECLGILLRIARGDAGYKGRYIGDRFKAISRLLDQLEGKPRQQVSVEHSGSVDLYTRMTEGRAQAKPS